VIYECLTDSVPTYDDPLERLNHRHREEGREIYQRREENIDRPLSVFLAGSLVMAGVLSFSSSDGIVSVFRGGVRDIGEFRRFIRNARSYTIRVPMQKTRFQSKSLQNATTMELDVCVCVCACVCMCGYGYSVWLCFKLLHTIIFFVNNILIIL